MSLQDTLQSLAASLPASFDFYHLGQVELSSSHYESALEILAPATPFPSVSVDRIGVAFAIQGEARGTLALLFDQGLDLSTYSEMGNIIASRMATDLADRQGIDVIISPPKVLSRAQIEHLLESAQAQSLLYLHRIQNRAIPIQALLLSEKTHV